MITEYLPSLRPAIVRSSFPEPPRILAESDERVATYLCERRRNPLAHAAARVVLDPDDMQPYDSIGDDMRIVGAIAAAVILHHHKVPQHPPADWEPEWELAQEDEVARLVRLAEDSA